MERGRGNNLSSMGWLHLIIVVSKVSRFGQRSADTAMISQVSVCEEVHP